MNDQITPKIHLDCADCTGFSVLQGAGRKQLLRVAALPLCTGSAHNQRLFREYGGRYEGLIGPLRILCKQPDPPMISRTCATGGPQFGPFLCDTAVRAATHRHWRIE